MYKTINHPFNILFLITIVLFPLSYLSIGYRQIFILAMLAIFQLFLSISINNKRLNNIDFSIPNRIIFTVLFLLLYYTVDKINIAHQLSIPIEIKKRIPLATIFLSIAVSVMMIRFIKRKSSILITNPLLKAFLFVCVGVVLFMFVLIIVVQFNYKIDFEHWYSLLNNLFKCIFIIAILNFDSTKLKTSRVLSITILMSIFLTFVLKATLS